MYEHYYGLRESPFKLTSNPRYLLLTSGHAEALNSIKYGVSSRRGIVVMTGEVGTGKSTILRAATASTTGSRFVEINNPCMTKAEFRQRLADGFCVRNTTRFLTELTSRLTALARQGTQTALMVDEAHGLPAEILEEIRLLSNIETDEAKLLPIVVAGQPELVTRLNDPSLRQLKQRIELRCSLSALKLKETAAYIAGRVSVAGGDATTVFDGDAVALIHACSQGIPRTISVICDNAMVSGFAADERPIRRKTVMQVCRDLDIEVPADADDHAVPPVTISQTARVPQTEARAVFIKPDRVPLPRPVGDTLTGYAENFRRFLQTHRRAPHSHES
jgi:general secretion pathway protein A